MFGVCFFVESRRRGSVLHCSIATSVGNKKCHVVLVLTATLRYSRRSRFRMDQHTGGQEVALLEFAMDLGLGWYHVFGNLLDVL